jgi:hypothetical protein
MNNPEKLAILGTEDESKQNKHNTICVGHHYPPASTTNNVYSKWGLLQITGGTNRT